MLAEQRTVILLHGQPGSPADWAGVSARLGRDAMVLAPSRPGYGGRGRPAVGFAANAAALLALMDRHRIERAAIAGYSWGGGVALAAAAAAPGRVSGLALVASVSPLVRAGRLDRLLALPAVGEAAAALALSAAAGALVLPRIRTEAEHRLPRQALSGLTDRRHRRQAWRSFAVEQRALVEELPRLAGGLAATSAPTVVVCGGSDHLVPPRTARELSEAIPGAVLETVPGAGHLLPHEHPNEVAEAIRRVLRG